MEKERKPGMKKEIVKQARENEELIQFVRSLTKEEISRIKEIRSFEELPLGSVSRKIALLNDALRRKRDQIKLTIKKTIWNIEDNTNMMRRLDRQIENDKITEKLKDGVTMTKSEVETMRRHQGWVRDSQANALVPFLGDLRTVVGIKDYDKNVILSLEEFDKYVLQVAEDVSRFGYNLFEELK